MITNLLTFCFYMQENGLIFIFKHVLHFVLLFYFITNNLLDSTGLQNIVPSVCFTLLTMSQQ